VAVYLITGASSGIGAALAVELGRRGHAVGLLARRADSLAQIAQDVQAAGGRAALAAADVTDPEATTAGIAAIEAALGPIEVLVANAGIGDPMPVDRFSAARARQLMRVNVEGVLNALDPVLPAMLARESGHIAVVSSIAGFRGLGTSGPYSASKAAVSTLFEALAVECAPRGVAVTTIHPGFVDTPILGGPGKKHPTPFLVPADRAARILADGLEARRRYIAFPWQMVWLMRLVHQLPWWVYEPLMRKAAPPPRQKREG
jgi:short-subunit dehydrogenase